MEKWPIMDPHLIMAYLFNKANLNVNADVVRNYWQHYQNLEEPWAMDAGLERIPLGLYGDSARVTTCFGQENVVGIFMNIPLWRPMSIRASRFLVTAIQEEMLHKHFTLDAIFKRVTWSINLLWDGLHPTCGPDGEPLPSFLAARAGLPITSDQRTFGLTEIRGNWGWHKKVWRFKASWTGHDICHVCKARAVGPWEDLYWNFESAGWMSANFTLVEFLALRMPARGLCAQAMWCFTFSCSLASLYVMFCAHVLQGFETSLGPLLAIRNFSPSMIRWCMMHILHLGLFYVINGATLPLL